MAISQQERERLAQQIEAEQARRRAREQDICDYAGRNFYVPETGMPIVLAPHQRWLRIPFTRGAIVWEDGTPKRDSNADLRNDPFPFTTILRSTIKKSGKSTEASIPMLYMAETQTRMGEIYAIGNDQEQAKGRSFKFAANSIRLTPGCTQKAGAWILPDRWAVHKTYMECYKTGTEIKAISVDARGEAGGNPDLTVWCVIGETEVMCRAGFKRADQLTVEDEIASLNPKTGVMEWQRPRAVNITPYKGRMVKFTHRRVSFVVTPNHRVLCKEKASAPGDWVFQEADTLRKRQGGWLPGAVPWRGEAEFDLDFATLPIGWTQDGDHWSDVEYDGLVVCPSLPNGTFFIRHEGKCIWTGNTELWGFEYEDALRFWDEMTQSPTKQNSIRLVETYAGYQGESNLLEGLYNAGLTGHQLTNHEFASLVGRPGVEGDTYEDILAEAFVELKSDPDGLTPVYMNEAAGLFMFWDEGTIARRMPWQQGEFGKKYYREQAATLPPAAFERFHENHWVSAESQFVPLELWDSCAEDLPPFRPKDSNADATKEQVVIAVDAATTGDCFGVVAITRHPDPKRSKDEVAVRAAKRWDPKEEGGRIDYAECEQWIKVMAASYNVVQICYDPYQLEDMMQRLRKEGVAWVEPFAQGQDRLTADRRLFDLILGRKLAWPRGGVGMEHLREHIQNANVKLQRDEDSKMRIVKKTANRKIDLTVALSMAADRCLYLLLS